MSNSHCTIKYIDDDHLKTWVLKRVLNLIGFAQILLQNLSVNSFQMCLLLPLNFCLILMQRKEYVYFFLRISYCFFCEDDQFCPNYLHNLTLHQQLSTFKDRKTKLLLQLDIVIGQLQ